MRAGVIAAALLLALPAAHAAEQTKRYTIEQLMAAETFGGISFSPDDQLLLTTSNRSGIANLYVVPVAGGPMQQLTHSTKETVNAIGYFPDDRRILY